MFLTHLNFIYRLQFHLFLLVETIFYCIRIGVGELFAWLMIYEDDNVRLCGMSKMIKTIKQQIQEEYQSTKLFCFFFFIIRVMDSVGDECVNQRTRFSFRFYFFFPFSLIRYLFIIYIDIR